MCYGVPKRNKKHPEVPYLSCGKTQAGIDAYLEEVCTYIKNENPLKLKLARAGSNLHYGEMPLDAVAQDIEDAYGVEMDRLRDKWFDDHPDGAFKAYRERTPEDVRPRPKSKKRSADGGRKTSKGPQKPKLAIGNMAEVHGTTFVTFNIFAHPNSGNLVVAYYEAEMMELDPDLSFEALRDLDSSHESDLYARSEECVAIGDYETVMDWVRNSEAVDSRHHIPGLSPTLCCDAAMQEVVTFDVDKTKAQKRKQPVKNTRK